MVKSLIYKFEETILRTIIIIIVLIIVLLIAIYYIKVNIPFFTSIIVIVIYIINSIYKLTINIYDDYMEIKKNRLIRIFNSKERLNINTIKAINYSKIKGFGGINCDFVNIITLLYRLIFNNNRIIIYTLDDKKYSFHSIGNSEEDEKFVEFLNSKIKNNKY